MLTTRPLPVTARLRQLQELLVLRSMFAAVEVSPPAVLARLQRWLGQTDDPEDVDWMAQDVNEEMVRKCVHLQEELRVTIGVEVEAPLSKIKLHLTWPPLYPSTAATASVSSPTLSRAEEGALAAVVNQELEGPLLGEASAFEAVQCLQENIAPTLAALAQTETMKTKTMPPVRKFQRAFIYFHHIYARSKKTAIVDVARTLSLTGFAVFGKPGLVCVEGPHEAVNDYVTRIRRLVWKKMSVRDRFEVDVTLPEATEDLTSSQWKAAVHRLRCFHSFGELVTTNRGTHPDRSALLAHLRTVGLEAQGRYTLGLEPMAAAPSSVRPIDTGSHLAAIEEIKEGSVRIAVHVKPNAQNTAVTDVNAAKEVAVRIAAAPRNGAVNQELCRFFSNMFNVPQSCVKLIRGPKARSKVIQVTGVTRDVATRVLLGEVNHK